MDVFGDHENGLESWEIVVGHGMYNHQSTHTYSLLAYVALSTPFHPLRTMTDVAYGLYIVCQESFLIAPDH